MTEQQRKEYEELKTKAINGTIKIIEAMKYFDLKDKAKRKDRVA